MVESSSGLPVDCSVRFTKCMRSLEFRCCFLFSDILRLSSNLPVITAEGIRSTLRKPPPNPKSLESSHMSLVVFELGLW